MDDKSKAMTLAGEYRSDGLDASEALTQAWEDIRGNPAGAKFAPSGLITILALGGAGLVAYRLFAKRWPWTKTMTTRVVSGNTAQPR